VLEPGDVALLDGIFPEFLGLVVLVALAADVDGAALVVLRGP